MASEKILIVDDEPSIRELIALALTSAGFTNLIEAADGESALSAARRQQPNLILLDLMMPGIDGLNVCRLLKQDESTRSIPVIMLTARSEESDIVLGLELGAADYITKPFSNKILVARIRAHLRSTTEATVSCDVRIAGLVMNTERHSAELCDEPLDLTPTEFDLLRLFAGHPGRVYTRNQIITKTKGEGYAVTDRTIDVQIVALRRKLGEWGTRIETVRGVGYRFSDHD